MRNLPPLDALGRRIVILGPTNAGKSTLAQALAARLGVAAVHLDQFRHLPHTDWQVRPDAEFRALHDEAILADAWVMDGNYSALLPQRLARATGVIVVDDHYLRRTLRYFRRTLFEQQRAGALPGHRDSIKREMLHWLWKTRNAAAKYRPLAVASGLPVVTCSTLTEVRALYRHWHLV